MKTLIITCLLAFSVNCLSQNNINHYSQFNPYSKAEKIRKSKIITFCSATIVSFALTKYGLNTGNNNFCKAGGGVFLVSFTYHFTFSLKKN